MAWYGRKNDFDEALLWFRELLNATKLSGSNLTFCPETMMLIARMETIKQKWYKDVDTMNRLYQYDQVHLMEAPLYNYEKFCEALGVTPYHYPRQDKWESSYAIGYKDVRLLSGEVFRIVSFNTALLSFVKNYPDDQMLIGQAQIRSLLEYGIIGSTRNYYTVALFHHAERFLHTQEICEYDQRYATLPLLRRYVDLVLCGHTETGGIPVLYKQIGGAEMRPVVQHTILMITQIRIHGDYSKSFKKEKKEVCLYHLFSLKTVGITIKEKNFLPLQQHYC